MIVAWMGYATLIAGVLAGAALALDWVLRAYRSPTRWLWVAAIVLSVFGPLAALGIRGDPDSREIQTDEIVISEARAETPSFSVPAGILEITDPSRLSRFDRPALFAWLIASMLLTGRYGASLTLLARCRRGWRMENVVGVPVRISPSLGPAVVGFLAPAIVLPEWIRTLDQRLVRLILAHEQEHLRKGDPRLIIAGASLVVLLPWNLPLWWLIRRLHLAIEIDCDQRVLANTNEVAPYAGLLCEIGTKRSHSMMDSLPLSQSALIRPAAFLERRIRHMTASVPNHRSWKALGVGVLAIALLGVSTIPAPPSTSEGEAQQRYHLLIAEIEYRNAQSIAELPSNYVIQPAQPGQPEKRWRETYEAYEDMEIVDRQIITREDICYTTRESDGSMRMRTRSTVPEIDSLMQITGDASAVSRFLSEENGGKDVNYMSSTVEDQAVCFLLRGEADTDEAVAMDLLPPSDERDALGDTIDFQSTPFARVSGLSGSVLGRGDPAILRGAGRVGLVQPRDRAPHR